MDKSKNNLCSTGGPELMALLQNQIDYYKSESAKYEQLFKRLFGPSFDIDESFPNIEQVQSPEETLLQFATNLREQNEIKYYMTHLGICHKLYVKATDNLKLQTADIQSDLLDAEQRLTSFANDRTSELKVLENKIEACEKQLRQFEEKNPWLKEKYYDLEELQKQINLLNTARDKKRQLLNDLNGYHGLKPNIAEANKQLEDVMRQYSQFK